MKKEYDIFISYSRKDYLMEDEKTPDPDKIVSKILNMLDAHNISYWIDKEGMYSSAQFAAVIEDQISEARCFLYVSTQASNASKYTLGEVFTAVEYGKPIIPFRADDSKFGKGIGLHLRPLDHIEYFKTGEEAFIKLVTSINHIKAEQLYDQLVAEYKDIVAEYKVKLRAKAEEMKALGINPPVDNMADDEALKMLRIGYEQEIAKHLEEKTNLEKKVADARKSAADLQEKLKCDIHELKEQAESQASKIKNQENLLAEKEILILSLKHSISEATRELDNANTELKAYKDKEERERKALEEEIHRKAEEENNRGVIKVGNTEFKMIRVEGGTFTMGEGNEAHQVTLSTYHIGETPVTQALWKEVMGNNPSFFEGDNKPVESVSWDDCQEFIKKLNQNKNKRFRLLTDAEWEFAARGGNRTKGYKFSGSDSINAVAWYKENSYLKGSSSPDYGTHPVKTKKPNELGIYDMSGNVWEWCQDWYGSYNKGSQTNPTGPSSGLRHVFHGGSWVSGHYDCRVSCRYGNTPDDAYNYLGFRLALSE